MLRELWRALRRRNRVERWLLCEAAAFSLIAAASLRIVPFRRLAARLEWLDTNDQISPLRPAERRVMQQVVRAVVSVNGRFRWRNRCLVEALVGRWMLQRRGIKSRLFLGAGKDKEGRLCAHAWLSCAGEIVTGGREAGRFKALTSF